MPIDTILRLKASSLKSSLTLMPDGYHEEHVRLEYDSSRTYPQSGKLVTS